MRRLHLAWVVVAVLGVVLALRLSKPDECRQAGGRRASRSTTTTSAEP